MKKKTKHNFYKSFFYTLTIALFLLFIIKILPTTFSKENESEIKTEKTNLNIENENNIMKVHYLDVGQGDSIFIELPNSKTMLIDAGDPSNEEFITDYIKNLTYNKIDYIIATHPHQDHIGSLAYIINNFKIDSIYMPKVVSTTKTYENLLNTIANKNLKINTAKAGVNITHENDLSIDIIAPTKDSYKDINNYSIILKITFKNKKFLFTGDAETESENEIKEDITADVIKIAHHGSNSSSSHLFLNKVKPKYAIISVGSENTYGHPHKEVIKRLETNGTKIYRTDLHGTIVIETDGNNINIKTERNET